MAQERARYSWDHARHETDEEEDVCRVCRTEAEPDNPLMYPCKCSGTIRYVHPECLKNWLAQSRKTYCELCGHKYAFSTVYAKEMPERLPLHVLVYGSILRSFRIARTVLRVIFVIFVWLVHVPKTTLYSLGSQMWLADELATALTRPSSNVTDGGSIGSNSSNIDPSVNMTSADNITTSEELPRLVGVFSPFRLLRIFQNLLTSSPDSHPILSYRKLSAIRRALSHNLFRAQLLCICLIGVFLGFFLLREWVLHHQEEAALARATTPPEEDPNPDDWEFERGQPKLKADREAAQMAIARALEIIKAARDNADNQREARGAPHIDADDAAAVLQAERDAWKARFLASFADRQFEQGDPDSSQGLGLTNNESTSAGSSSGNAEVAGQSDQRLRGSSSKSDIGSTSPLALGAVGLPDALDEEEGALSASDTFLGPLKDHAVARDALETSQSHLGSPSPARDSAEMMPDIKVSLRADLDASTAFAGVDKPGSAESVEDPLTDLPSQTATEIPSGPGEAVTSQARRPLFGTTGLYTQGQTSPMATSATTVNTPIADDSAFQDVSGDLPQSTSTRAMYTAPQEPLLAGEASTESESSGGDIVRLRSPARERPPLVWNSTVPFPSPKHESAVIEFTEVPGVIPTSSDVVQPTTPDGQPGDLSTSDATADWVGSEGRKGTTSEQAFPPEVDHVDEVKITQLPRPVPDTPDDTADEDWEEEEEEEGGEEDEPQHGVAERDEHGDVLNDIEIVELEDGEELPENEDFGLWDPEEWDGVLDMIGLRGSFLHFLLNVCIANMVLNTAVIVVLSFPAVVGKVALLVNIAAVQRILLAPIRLIRFLTDPIVDLVVEVITDVIYNPAAASGHAFVGILRKRFPSILSVVTDPVENKPRSAVIAFVKEQSVALWSLRRSKPFKAVVTEPNQGLSSKIFSIAEDVFAALGRASIAKWKSWRHFADHLAASKETFDRGLIILWGYIQVGCCVVFIGLFGEDVFGPFAAPIVSAIRQQGIILKLLVFMVIELVGFPLGAGLALQASLLPLVPGASFASRTRDFLDSPFLSVFVAWLFGTLFMFSFASLLAMFREVCRPGTMFFVRDPQDHNYSPVKDIVERSTISQLRKLLFSAWMYGVVIVSLFGVVPLCLQAPKSLHVLPLRISNLDPLSNIPFDMIFIHILLPASITYLRPQKIFRRCLGMWWRKITRWLRLSSFMYNKRVPAEEEPRDTAFENYVLPAVDVIATLIYGKGPTNESMTRVPNDDKVALLTAAKSKGGMFVQLDDKGVPRTEEGKLKILRQNQAAIRNKRDPHKDYTIVWLPSYFQARINLFLLGALTTGALGLGVCAYVPLVAGRALLERILDSDPAQIHDGYSYMAGFYFLWAAVILGRWVQKKVAMMGRAPRLRRSVLSTRIKRRFLSLARDTYRVFAIHGIWPILCGLVIEMYILVPCKYGLRPDVTPVIHVWEAWALGCAVNSMLVHITDFARQAPTGHVMAMRILLKDPFATSVQEVSSVLRPLITGAICLIAAPGVFIHLAVQVNPAWRLKEARNTLLFRLAYAIVVAVVFIKVASKPAKKFARKWVQALRDRHYGVETRLENYEKADEPLGDGAKTVEIAALHHDIKMEGDDEEPVMSEES